MVIIYTDYARFRMKIREISEDMVHEALTTPDRVATGYHNRKLAYKTFTKGIIKVVYTLAEDNPVIISAMWE